MAYSEDVGELIHTGSGGGVFSLEWRIPDFLSLDGGGGDHYGSPFFTCCGGEWQLRMCPKELRGNPPSECVSIDLFKVDIRHPETFDVTLGIRGTEGVEYSRKKKREFSEDYDTCSWNAFVSIEEMRLHASRLMPGSALAIVLDMTRDNVARGVRVWQESLLELLDSGKESDVVIKVKGQEFRAHRILLQARSSVFESMFSHDMVEKQSGVVTMEDCDPEIFPDFLKYIYTGCTDGISEWNVYGLYSASDKYDLYDLKEQCIYFVKKNICVATFCETFTLLLKHDMKELIEVASKFFCAYALDIVKTVEWQTFLAENPTVGNDLYILSYSQKK